MPSPNLLIDMAKQPKVGGMAPSERASEVFSGPWKEEECRSFAALAILAVWSEEEGWIQTQFSAHTRSFLEQSCLPPPVVFQRSPPSVTPEAQEANRRRGKGKWRHPFCLCSFLLSLLCVALLLCWTASLLSLNCCPVMCFFSISCCYNELFH